MMEQVLGWMAIALIVARLRISTFKEYLLRILRLLISYPIKCATHCSLHEPWHDAGIVLSNVPCQTYIKVAMRAVN